MIVVLLALVRANNLDRTAAWLENIRNDRDDLAGDAATIENGSHHPRRWPARVAW